MAAIPIYYKKASEKYPIGLEYTLEDIITGDSISAVEVTIDPSGDLEIEGSPSYSGRNCSAWVKAGVAGKRYHVTFKVTTGLGYIYINSILVEVKEDK